MRFTLDIDCSNAALEIAPEQGIATILHAFADRIARESGTAFPGDRWPLRDENGNTVGHAVLLD